MRNYILAITFLFALAFYGMNLLKSEIRELKAQVNLLTQQTMSLLIKQGYEAENIKQGYEAQRAENER